MAPPDIELNDCRVRRANIAGGSDHPWRDVVLRLPNDAATDRALGKLSKLQREGSPVTVRIGFQRPALDWIVVGGESGPNGQRRDLDHEWARAIREQCRAAAVSLLRQAGLRRPRGHPPARRRRPERPGMAGGGSGGRDAFAGKRGGASMMTNEQTSAAYRCWKASLPIGGNRLLDRPHGMQCRTMAALVEYELLRPIDDLHGDDQPSLWIATRKLDQMAWNCGWGLGQTPEGAEVPQA